MQQRDWGSVTKLLRVRINAAFAAFKVRAAVAPSDALIMPAWISFDIWVAGDERVERVTATRKDLALRLRVNPHDLRFVQGGNGLVLQVPRAERGVLHLAALLKHMAPVQGAAGEVSALVGIDGAGTPCVLPLTAASVTHVLIAGTTGSGKSVLTRNMVYWLVREYKPEQVALGLIDPKTTQLALFNRLPHVAFYASSSTDALGWLHWTVAEMERRQRASQHTPRLFVVVDELYQLVQSATPDVAAGIAEAITTLVSTARDVGIHLIVSTQKPLAAVTGSIMKANFPGRVCMHVSSAQDAYTALGRGDSGAENLPTGCAVVVVDSQMEMYQVPYMSLQDMSRAVAALPYPRRKPPVLSAEYDSRASSPMASAPERHAGTLAPPARGTPGRRPDEPTPAELQRLYELYDEWGSWDDIPLRRVQAALGNCYHQKARRIIADLRARDDMKWNESEREGPPPKSPPPPSSISFHLIS